MILGINASPRSGGNSKALVQAVLDAAAEHGPSGRAAHLMDYRFEPCVGCEQCRKDKICTRFNDGMTLLYPEIIESRGLVLVSPVHNYNVSALMKAFIDRLYCFYDFEDTRPRAWSSRLAGQGRKAVIAAVAEQTDKKDMGFTLEAMRLPLQALGYEIVAEVAVLKVFDRGAVRQVPQAMAEARNAGQALGRALRPALDSP